MDEFFTTPVAEKQAEVIPDTLWDMIILGAGPGGLTAGIYAGRSGLNVMILEKLSPGGQIAVSEQIDNYPGFPDGISGTELVERMEKQAVRFGTRIVMEEGIRISKEGKLFVVTTTGDKKYRTKTIIISTGADPVKLPVPEEEKFRGKGVSYCATCDAAFFRGKDVAIVGGGDTAIADALHLTRFANKVIIVHRRRELRAVKVLQEEVFANPKVVFQWDSIPSRVIGDEMVEGLEIENVKTKEKKVLKVNGIFAAIGTVPNSKIVRGIVELDERGFVKTNYNRETSVPGIFAVGDVRDTPLRQVITAAGDGAIAEFSAENYIKLMER
ncbi:MAG: thioredoxin-disulfide reductase [Caldisericaceae bacterium]|nr:thioredoxin-disulfide reductase [Caldisericaceae bacterium]